MLKTLSTDTSKSIARGQYLKLGDITTNLNDYVAPTSHNAEHPAIAGAIDLSATASANCYTVDAANTVYKFKAYKGNSSTGVGDISTAVLLWETYNTTEAVSANSVIAQVDFDKQESNAYYEVCFKTPATLHTGNALIAVKDISNNILWSWHIWIPSSAITPITDSDFSATSIMDRNLGAIEPVVAGESEVPTSSFGLYYQWGRKDPFITSNWGRNASIAFSYSSSTWVSTETAIQNPTVFYKKVDESTEPRTCNWNSSEIPTLWDDSGKTIYDPCPPGYKVDVFNSEKRLWKHNDTSNWESNTTYGWLKYKNITFPLAGYTENLSSYKVKERTVIWSATYLSRERGNALYANPNPSYDSYYKYVGASIRCVTEE